MPKYTLKKTTRTIKLLLASAIGVVFLSAPFLTHATSEPNSQAPTTNTHLPAQPASAPTVTLAQPTSWTKDTSIGQNNLQEKNSILSLKTGRNLLKLGDLALHLLVLSQSPWNLKKKDLAINVGFIGTSAALIESIVKDYEASRKQNNSSMRSNVFILCKLLGVMGHIFLGQDEYKNSDKSLGIVFALGNSLGFLIPSLYGDYKSYVATKENSNTQSAPSNDKIASTNKKSQPAP